jgi:hypothetical protein
VFNRALDVMFEFDDDASDDFNPDDGVINDDRVVGR